MRLNIYRGNTKNEYLNIDEKTKYSKKLLGEHHINVVCESSRIIDLQIGDYITFEGNNYYLNQSHSVKKLATNHFEYTCTFESLQYELLKVQYQSISVAREADGQGEFYIYGTPYTFLQLLISNMNRSQSGWTYGGAVSKEAKNLYFNNENCLRVLQRLCDEFEIEFKIEGKTIALVDKVEGTVTDLTFEYGKNNSLYSLSRNTIQNENIVTRLYAFGSTKNLPSDYRNYSKRLKFEAGYIELNTESYGVIEASKNFDDVYPHFTGRVRGSTDLLNFSDSNISFDLNEQLLPGVNAKVHFNSGNLAGMEFEISSFDNDTKTVTLVQNTDEFGNKYPSETIRHNLNDLFVFVDIKMPQSYIDSAESELLTKATSYLEENAFPKVNYSLVVNQKYFKDNAVNLDIGSLVTLFDSDLGINKVVRILSVSKSVAFPYIQFTIGDEIEISYITRMYAEQLNQKNLTSLNKLADVSKAKRSYISTQELKQMMFDPDNYFNTDRIKPLSIETGMLSVGMKSTQFILKDVTVQPNYQGDKNMLYMSAGQLIHFSIGDTTRIWDLNAYVPGGLVDNNSYYIYAACLKDSDIANVVFSTSQYNVDDGSRYWFLLGVLHSVQNGVRAISFTYGQTFINGKFITTGRVSSQDGMTWIDLDTGQIQGNITITGGTGYQNLDDAPDMSNYVDAVTYNQDIASIQSQLDGSIINWFFDYDPTTSNYPANSWTTDTERESHRGDTFTNEDSGVSWRYSYNGSSYYWKVIDDTVASQALALAAEAKDTADNKRRVFVVQPAPPYDVGDLWVQGTSGDIMRCSNAKVVGQTYSSSDWIKASKYTDDSALTTFVSTVYNSDKSDFQNQIDGKVESFFQEADTNTWLEAERAKHNGDWWFKTSTKKLYRYISSSNTWELIEDQKAIDAFNNAAKAQDTADGKRRVFTTNPTTPYDVGDLWTDGTNIRRCIRARTEAETYNASDWGLASNYDNTQVTIDSGIVTAGRFIVKSGDNIERGGIRGTTGTGGSFTGFWLGSTYANRDSAPLRATHEGKLFCVSANIAGGWEIDNEAIYTGEKKIRDGFSNSGITLAANGSLHAKNFCINQDGNVKLKAIESEFVSTYKAESIFQGNVHIKEFDIYDSLANSPNGMIRINYKGYNGGVSQARGTIIGDGRNNTIARFQGGIPSDRSDNMIDFQAPKFFINRIPSISEARNNGFLGEWDYLVRHRETGLIAYD